MRTGLVSDSRLKGSVCMVVAIKEFGASKSFDRSTYVETEDFEVARTSYCRCIYCPEADVVDYDSYNSGS